MATRVRVSDGMIEIVMTGRWRTHDAAALRVELEVARSLCRGTVVLDVSRCEVAAHEVTSLVHEVFGADSRSVPEVRVSGTGALARAGADR
ncbi:hypothetical protein Amsp01_087450 [Amycolatopsis sp. NBRC 101858]|uniref:hypothetical protein n=1 Tax=Amycolatopsis sp. NBRC 101858 TaxID=3032200 RepID=UPI0024A0497C|nr:hypothetical protein [Amycolatopsis sp. NBRC 101858]GLY42722.1 hypothetical protein Amsp01_087450 [Amycolatopsis sp. NBRC 101858]